MRSLYLIVIALLLLPGIGRGQAKSTSQSVKTFTVTLTKIKGERKGWQWSTDVLTLNGSKFSSKVMKEKEKIPPAVCKVFMDTLSSVMTLKFAGVTQNRGISKLKWQGAIHGDSIWGRAEWNNGQGVQTYTFTGKSK